ncbi:hypothetical protein D3C75_956060 [compost metagenome]
MPFLQELHALPEGILRPLLERQRHLRAVIHHHLPGQSPHAALAYGLEGRIRMMHRFHIQYGGGAAPDKLPQPQHGGIIDGIRIMSRLQGPDPLAQPVDQLQVVGAAAEERLA